VTAAGTGAGQGGASRGIGLALLAFAMFSIVDLVLKVLAAHHPLFQLIFIHTAFSLVPILLVAARTGGGLRANLSTRKPGWHALRAACGTISGLCVFYAFKVMPMADVYALVFTAPLFITALSVPMLGEKVGWRRWSAVAVGFAGILLVLRPGAGLVSPAALAALASAFFYSLGMLIARRMRGTESSVSFGFYSCCAGLTVNALIIGDGWQPMPWEHVAMLAFSGTIGATALICLLTAFRRTDAAVIAPLQYSQMLWGVLYGWLVFGTLPGGMLALGAGIVIASGLYILHRETRVGAAAAGTPPSVPTIAGQAPVPLATEKGR